MGVLGVSLALQSLCQKTECTRLHGSNSLKLWAALRLQSGASPQTCSLKPSCSAGHAPAAAEPGAGQGVLQGAGTACSLHIPGHSGQQLAVCFYCACLHPG